MEKIRQCRKCGERNAEKLVARRNLCKECWNAQHRAYLEAHPEQRQKARDGVKRWHHSEKGRAYVKTKNAAYYAEHREERVRHTREWREERRKKIFDIYGRVCVCCGITEELFLTIDHVKGGGKQDHQEHGGHAQFYWWLANQPKSPEYQTMCFNCNCGRQRNNEICPHQDKELMTNGQCSIKSGDGCQ